VSVPALEPLFEGVVRQAEAIAEGRLGALELARAYLDRIDALDPQLGAYLHVDREGALAAAAAVDRRRAAGESLGPLAGVPLAIKDNLCTRGMPTTCASRFLEGYRPPYDAHVVERLRAQGAVILGKTNLDEFAMGSSNESSAFFAARNPWDTSRVPGGSSGGSAVATAAGLAAASLGSDTGGSVRQPAAFCGVTALKPTYGRISRYGLVAFASSLDQVGPIGRSVRDVARLFTAIAGHDPRDATSSTRPLDAHARAAEGGARGKRIGVLRSELEAADLEIRAPIEAALGLLEAAGARLEEISLPHARHAVSIYYVIATAEASSNLARFDGMRYGARQPGPGLLETYEASRSKGFGPEVRRRILLGTYVLSAGYQDAYYLRAERARTRLREDYARAFERVDLLAGPVTPTAAFRLDEKAKDPLAMYLSDVFTLPASLAGVPALSAPVGFTPSGLPVGLQLTAPAFEEARLFELGAALEPRLGCAERRPPLAAS